MNMNLWNKFEFWLFELHNRKYKKIDDEYHEVNLTPELVAERFKLLFKLHGVEVTEIPELEEFKDITLYDLNSNDRLLKKLPNDRLRDIAEYFGVRIEWLRSGEPDMYMQRSWYKDWLYKFFIEWKEIDSDELHDPFYILTTTDKFDVYSDEYQPFILVLKKPLAKLNEKDMYQYRFESVWNWHHAPCRLQAKGIATKYYELTHRMIPMYTTSRESFYKVQQGYIPPNVGGRNHKVSFEEYAVIKNAYFPLYEEEEHSSVLNEMECYKIYDITLDSIGQPREDGFSDEFKPYIDDDCEKESIKVSLNPINVYQKAAYARHQPVYEIKRKCVMYWIKTGKKYSYIETARRFCKELPDNEKSLTRTGRVDTLSEAISEYERRDKLEADSNLPQWLEGFKPEE